MKVYILFLINIFLITSSSFGNTTIGADLVSRYVWRGQDYGNTAAVQPYIEKTIGSFSFGAWGSSALNQVQSDSSPSNECDLYVSGKLGSINLILTDYFNPKYKGQDKFFNIEKHTIELSSELNFKEISFFLASNVFGDDSNSLYLEYNYKMLSFAAGNGLYSNSGNFTPVSIGLKVLKDNLSVSYIINPDRQTSFLVFSISL